MCKYCYPKYKDYQILYLTSFKIAADFNFKYLKNCNFSRYLNFIFKLLFLKKFCFSSHLAETDNIVNQVEIIVFLFLLTFFFKLIFREGIFGTDASLIPEFIIQSRSIAATIPKNLFLVLKMTSNCANKISNDRQRL